MGTTIEKTVDLHLCKGCGICIEICPKQVYDRDQLGKPIVARDEVCTYCHLCELHCPDFAIDFVEAGEKIG